jgi:dolichol-phosphate mannosyltransferase
VSWIGFRQVGVPFVRRGRAGGVTKYRFSRLLRLALDTLTSFSTLPALALTVTAGALATLSVLLLSGVVLLWAVGAISLEGWMWAALGFLLLSNIQLVFLAVLGEYVVRTHRHTQRRPLYVVESVIDGRNAAVESRPQESLRGTPEVCHPSALVSSAQQS